MGTEKWGCVTLTPIGIQSAKESPPPHPLYAPLRKYGAVLLRDARVFSSVSWLLICTQLGGSATQDITPHHHYSVEMRQAKNHTL